MDITEQLTHESRIALAAAEVQRLRIALEQIELEANQPYIQRIAAEALALTTTK